MYLKTKDAFIDDEFLEESYKLFHTKKKKLIIFFEL